MRKFRQQRGEKMHFIVNNHGSQAFVLKAVKPTGFEDGIFMFRSLFF